jgi:hypothetical protein
MSTIKGWVLFACGAAVAIVAALVTLTASRDERAPPAQSWPRPLDGEPGEQGQEFGERRRRWIERLHAHAPGVDWRRLDAQYREQRFVRQQEQLRIRLASGAGRADLLRVELPEVSGTWVERGSDNQAGRILSIDFDAATERLTVIADGGQLWRAGRADLDWRSPNDGAVFPGGEVLRLGGPSERLIVATEEPPAAFRSDDGGTTWTEIAGSRAPNSWRVRGAVRAGGGGDVYLIRERFPEGSGNLVVHLYVSADRGQTFTDAGQVGRLSGVALTAPRYDSNAVYLLVENRLKRIESGTHALVDVGTLPIDPTQIAGSVLTLSSGVAGGVPFLYAFVWPSANGGTDAYRSLDGGQTWELRGTAPTGLFTVRSAASSSRDPAQAFVGGVDAYRTADGGVTWTPVNSWVEYYGAPATRLHADIPAIDVWRDAAGAERVLVATDGGLYESRDGLATVQNLALRGMRVSQYYSTFTGRSAPFALFAGSQDQGYQKTLAPTGAIESFTQAISGDYGSMVSSDAGASLWMNYPGFTLFDADTGLVDRRFRVWTFTTNGFTANDFIAPLAVDPDDPHRAWIPGTVNGSGSQLVRLEYTGDQIAGVAEPYQFGNVVSAVAAASGGRRYAITSDRRFYRERAGTWAATPFAFPTGNFFFGRDILVHPSQPGRLYLAGSGYSAAGVYRSDDDGDTFVPQADGLPSTQVNDLAMSRDGAHLFAATDVGPFYFDAASARWVDLTGLGAPNQVYSSVEFVDPQNRARFGTYGRGIWDFVLPGPPPPIALNQQGLSGLWYEPATSGQGFALEFFPNLEAPGRGLLSGGWFTFDTAPSTDAGGQRWYSVSGPLPDGTGTAALRVYRNVGGNFAAPPVTTAQAIGNAALSFSACNRGRFDYQLDDGRSGSIDLERLTPAIGCDAARAVADAADFGFSGNWYDAATSGQGFLFEVNPRQPLLFFAWYTYAPGGQALGVAGQRWFTGQTTYARGSRTFTMPINETSGGRFDLAPSAAQRTIVVGSTTVTFQSCTTATLSYAFDAGQNAGRTGTIALARVGPAPAGCRP